MGKLLIVMGFVMIFALTLCVEAKPNYISINKCQTLNVTNGYYILKENITTPTYSCFTVTANGTTLDLNGYSVTYSDDGGSTGVSLYRVKNFTLKNGKIINFEEGIESYEGNSQIINVSFFNNADYAIYFRSESNSVIKGNTFTNSSIGRRSFVVEIEDSFNVSILENTFLNNGGGLSIEDGGNNFIKNNSIINSGNSSGIEIQDSPNTTVSDIFFKDNRLDVDFGDCSLNVLPLVGSDGWPILYYNSQVNVTNVRASEIILCNGDGSYFSNITISSRGKPLNGFFVSLTDNAYFSNIILNNTSEGLLLDRSQNNTLAEISLTNNAKNGLGISQSHNNLISKSIMVNNAGNGIDLGGSDFNLVMGNRIEGNLLKGIHLANGAINNSIYNNFLRNKINAPLPFRNNIPYENFWSTNELIEGPNIIGGPYIGGNYWGSFDGSAHSEVCLDLDGNGICEWLYAVNQLSIDYLPLH